MTREGRMEGDNRKKLRDETEWKKRNMDGNESMKGEGGTVDEMEGTRIRRTDGSE